MTTPDLTRDLDAREALQPFVTFAQEFVEKTEGGWQWLVGSGRDRISDWFGPSDFGLLAHFASALSEPAAPAGAEVVDGPEEIEIDRLRLAAFKTPSNENKAAYYLAVSKWFQDRHYRRLATPQPVEPPDDSLAVEPVAWQWRALEDGEPCTAWKDPELGDRPGWEALAKRNPEKYATERRALYSVPQPPDDSLNDIAAGNEAARDDEWGEAGE